MGLLENTVVEQRICRPQEQPMSKAIWWIRRDLRLSDNPALQAALQNGLVIPVYVMDPHLLARTPVRRQAFLYEGLQKLAEDLRTRKSCLTIRRGNPAEVLAAVLAESEAQAIFAEEDFTPYARQRDAQIANCLPLRLIQGQTVHHPADVIKADETPYTVFTPFSRTWKASLPSQLSVLSAPGELPTPPPLPSEALPKFVTHPSFTAGEAEAQSRLNAFLDERIYTYADNRNILDQEGTSQLSPYIRFGMLSLRQAAAGALTHMNEAPNSSAAKSAETWLNELIWREFYISILYHFPVVLRQSFRPDLQNVKWQNSPADLEAWQQGLTGYPVVDAGMRQLAQLGWMHNRARMITASFLVKDLLVDWRLGENWFKENLLDGDPAANNGGWQWTAGTGTDAAPYFRIFNPILQSKKCDPQGSYIRRWVPELAGVPERYIHSPWEMPDDVGKQAGCVIGKDYPAPIVDHFMARQRVLEVYGQAIQK
jgi:deoxyribodipyrimidine photo-lyase